MVLRSVGVALWRASRSGFRASSGMRVVRKSRTGREATRRVMRRSVGMFFAVDQALFDEAVDDAGDGAVGEADGVAELLEAETLGANEFGHDEALWPGEVSAGELGLKALTHAALNDVELSLGVLREGAKFG